MIARQSVWRDPKVQELAARFIPCADEIWRLQNRDEPDCKHFQSFMDTGRRLNGTADTVTRQGTYCVAPSGVLLGSLNSRDPAGIARLLESSLAKWDALSREERLLPFDPALVLDKIDRAENRWPKGGLVLRVVSRDLPRPGDTRDQKDWRVGAWNFDHAWFTGDEVARFVPKDLVIGAEAELPADLARRLTRLHLVDNVRGQTMGYDAASVRRAQLTLQVTAVLGERVQLALTGAAEQADTRFDHDGQRPNRSAEPTRGIDVALLGHAEFDTGTGRFTGFELVAVGTRFGATRFNERAQDKAPAPIGFLLHLAGDDPTERVAPAEFYSYGWR